LPNQDQNKEEGAPRRGCTQSTAKGGAAHSTKLTLESGMNNKQKNSIPLSRESNKLPQKKENRQGFFKKIKRGIHWRETIPDLI